MSYFPSRISVVALITGLLSLTPIPVRAQTPAAAPVVNAELASEDALVHYALAHNPDLRAAHWEQDVAAASVTSAAALNNPVARGEWLHVQSPADYGWGVGLEWEPPQPGVYGSGKDAARAQMRAVKADFSERSADLEAEVRRRLCPNRRFDRRDRACRKIRRNATFRAPGNQRSREPRCVQSHRSELGGDLSGARRTRAGSAVTRARD